MKILDLTQFTRRTMPVRLPDGTEVNLQKPSQALVIELMGLENQMKEGASPENVLEVYSHVVQGILNNNAEGIRFEERDITNQLDLELGMVLVQAYAQFMQEVQADPNSASPASRGKARKTTK